MATITLSTPYRIAYIDGAYLGDLINAWAKRQHAAGRYDANTHADIVLAYCDIAESENPQAVIAGILATIAECEPCPA